MSLAIVHSRAQVGVEAPTVTVEAHLANGLPSLALVGLPETAVKESKDRVRSAILTSGFDFPARRITLNLAPADLPKDGGRFDLAIALGILAASAQIPGDRLDSLECLGELALSGALRPVQGVLPAALAARKAGRALLVPKANAEEASLASGLVVYAADHLLEVAAHFNGVSPIAPFEAQGLLRQVLPYPDLADVQGQAAAKRGLLVAAAGAHNLLFFRAARDRQDSPGQPSAGSAASAGGTGSAGSRGHTVGSQSVAIGKLAAAAISAAPSQCIGASAGGRRQSTAPRRDHPGASRRAVSGRAARIRPQGTGGAS